MTDPVVERRITVQDSVKARALVSRRGDDRELDRVERKDVRAASRRFEAFLDRFENGVQDLQRPAWTGPGPPLCGAIDGPRQFPFELSCLVKNVHAPGP